MHVRRVHEGVCSPALRLGWPMATGGRGELPADYVDLNVDPCTLWQTACMR